MITSINMPLGPLYTHTKSHDHKNLGPWKSYKRPYHIKRENKFYKLMGHSSII